MESKIEDNDGGLGERYNDEKVKIAATKDAIQIPPIPFWNSEKHASYIFGLKNDVEEAMHRLSGNWKKDEENLNVLIEQTKQEYHNHVKLTNAAKEEKDNAEKAFHDEKGLDPPPGQHYNITAYWIALAVFILITVGINMMIFQSSQVSLIAVGTIGLFMGIVLVACGHLFGANAQRKDFLTNKKRLLLLCIVFIVPIILIAAVGQMHERNAEQPWLVFAGSNYAVFLVVSALAYFYYDELLIKVMNARKKFAQCQSDAVEAYKALMGAIRKHRGTFDQYAEKKYALIQRFGAIRSSYQNINLQSRADKMQNMHTTPSGMPQSFTVSIELELPGSLEEDNYNPPDTDSIAHPPTEHMV